MEHSVLVSLSPQALRESLGRPDLLARCLPGFTPDRSGEPGSLLSGRLRLRVAGATITYRGEVRALDDPDALFFRVTIHQAVGDGGVTGTVRVRLTELGPAATEVRFEGGFRTDGRLAELDADSVAQAAHRLVERFCTLLSEDAEAINAQSADFVDDDLPADTLPGTGTGATPPSASPASPGPLNPDKPAPAPNTPGTPNPSAPDDLSDEQVAETIDALDAALDQEPPAEAAPPQERLDDDEEETLRTVFGEILHPEQLADPAADIDDDAPNSAAADIDDDGIDYLMAVEEPLAASGEAPRRSILGRSAEEVDHAPPRGRYGPALPARAARSRGTGGLWGLPYRRLGEPPALDLDRARGPWVVGGGVALIGGAVLLVRALRRHGD